MTDTDPDPNPGPESEIDIALVDRVSERLAMGMPLRIALAGEPVTRAEYKNHLLQHPELAAREDIAKQNLLQNAFDVMLAGENAAANFRWLLERVYPDVVGGPDDESAKPKQTILGLPEEVLEQIREKAKHL